MRNDCIAAVNAAAGRTLTAAQIKALDDKIHGTMKRLGMADPLGWAAKSMDQKVSEAAVAAVQDMQAQSARKVANAQRQALASAATEQRIADLQANMGSNRTDAQIQDINNTNYYIEGIKRAQMAQLMDLVEAAGSAQGAGIGRRLLMFLFDAQNPGMTDDLVTEIFANGSGITGNKVAKAGADAWLKVIEAMRQRFNAAGGDIGKLLYGYLPQPHDPARVRAAGRDAWANKTMPLLDRRRYVREDGSRMSDAQVLDFLRGAYDTISTDGMNKTAPGQMRGSGAKANAGSESRQIHFKDGAAYKAYMGDFGRGSMYDAMAGHIGGMARDIGLVERYGPNPEAQFRLQDDLSQRADGGKKRDFGNDAQAYWDIVSGVTGAPESASLANIGQHARNIQVFSKLQGSVISSITDIGTIIVTAGYNKLPYWQVFKNIGKTAASKETRDFLTMHGLIAESMSADMNRWAGENIANNWSGRIANSTMKLSLMNAWTDSMRRGFSMTMMQSMAKLSKKDWGQLTEWDRSHLQRKGITEDDWGVVTKAQLTDFQGAQFLTPEAIAASGDARATEVTAKVLGFITDESEYAVLNPDLATKAITTWGGKQAGTVTGEFARATMQFKSFPIAMISRHWRRMLEGSRDLEGAPMLANKAAYTAALALTTTALGGLVFQAKQLKDGKDPVDMTTPKFWFRAAAQGGGAGFIGDLVLGDTTEDRSNLDTVARLAGPTVGDLADLWELTKGNIDEAIAGKQTHAGAEALRFAKGHTPLVNLWYGKAALDHLLMHGIQENLSPGYLARITNKAKKDWGQGWYWKPGSAIPERAPDLSAVAGN